MGRAGLTAILKTLSCNRQHGNSNPLGDFEEQGDTNGYIAETAARRNGLVSDGCTWIFVFDMSDNNFVFCIWF